MDLLEISFSKWLTALLLILSSMYSNADTAPGFPVELYQEYELHTDSVRSDTIWYAPKLGTIASATGNTAYTRISSSSSPLTPNDLKVKIETVVSSLPTLQSLIKLKQSSVQLGYRNLRPINPTSNQFRLLAVGEEIDINQKLICKPIFFGQLKFKQCFYTPFFTPWEAKNGGGFYMRHLEDEPMVARVAYLQTHLESSFINMIDNVLQIADRWDSFLMLIHEWDYLSPNILGAKYKINYQEMAALLEQNMEQDQYLDSARLESLKQQIIQCQCAIKFPNLNTRQRSIALDYYLKREFFQSIYVKETQIPFSKDNFAKVYIPSLGPQSQQRLESGEVQIQSNISDYAFEFTDVYSSAGEQEAYMVSTDDEFDLVSRSQPIHHRHASLEGPSGDRIQGSVFYDLHCVSGRVHEASSFQQQGALWQLNSLQMNANGYFWAENLNGCESKRYLNIGFGFPFIPH